ncbi:hypothetical protein Pth03_69380 [Planotetraspora thailandica]|uniref:Uncharacterized protein n=1 Tax=Planotetraspora thailandica TaxID=487172 RepID=A0A8J3Y0I9_9ACTN|nr:hypothetical protein Pth03_69380 [Planotetraspora thailandica]
MFWWVAGGLTWRLGGVATPVLSGAEAGGPTRERDARLARDARIGLAIALVRR